MTICKNCNSILFDNEKTCRYCGADKETGKIEFRPEDNYNDSVYGPPEDMDFFPSFDSGSFSKSE